MRGFVIKKFPKDSLITKTSMTYKEVYFYLNLSYPNGTDPNRPGASAAKAEIEPLCEFPPMFWFACCSSHPNTRFSMLRFPAESWMYWWYTLKQKKVMAYLFKRTACGFVSDAPRLRTTPASAQ